MTWTPEQARSELTAAYKRLQIELVRTEGDLEVAVHEATMARASLAERDREAEASAARWRAMADAAWAAQPEEEQ